MNLRVDSFKPLGEHLKLPAPGEQKVSGQSFGDVLKDSLQEVNDLQVNADRAVEDLASGRNKNIHETMINISKADLAFRMTLQIRNKAIEAYQEIMRTNI